MSKVVNKVPELIANLMDELTEFTRSGAEDIRDEIKKLGDEPKSGKNYGTHQASAPGEAWANQTGDLINSFTFEEMILATTVGSYLERALWLTDGTEDKDGNTLIEPRPTVEKAFENVLPTLETKLQAAVSAAKIAAQ